MKKNFTALILFLSCEIAFADILFDYYSKYHIGSLDDLYRVCEPLMNDKKEENEQLLNSLICITYFSGVLNGYSSTISIDAEYHMAKLTGLSRTTITQKLDTNSDIHEKISSIANASDFVCRKKGYHVAELAAVVINSMIAQKISGNRSPHYYVLNEIANFWPCDMKTRAEN